MSAFYYCPEDHDQQGRPTKVCLHSVVLGNGKQCHARCHSLALSWPRNAHLRRPAGVLGGVFTAPTVFDSTCIRLHLWESTPRYARFFFRHIFIFSLLICRADHHNYFFSVLSNKSVCPAYEHQPLVQTLWKMSLLGVKISAGNGAKQVAARVYMWGKNVTIFVGARARPAFPSCMYSGVATWNTQSLSRLDCSTLRRKQSGRT